MNYTQVEIKIVCDWAKKNMVVKSGTRRMTFKLEQQKQTLLENFRAASPRLFRKLHAQDPTLRATSATGSNMTILQKNIEYGLWLSRQPGFEEGDAADAKELLVVSPHATHRQYT